MKKGDRYLKIVEWSEDDQCYVGSIPGWIGSFNYEWTVSYIKHLP